MQTKATMKYCFIPLRMAIVLKKKKRTSDDKNVEKLEPLYTICGNAIVQPLWKMVWRFLKKLNLEVPYDPAISFLGI